MVDTDVVTRNADVHELNANGLQGLNLVAIFVSDGHVEGNHVVDSLALRLGGGFNSVGNAGRVDLLHDDLGALGQRAFGSFDLHNRPTCAAGDRLLGITRLCTFGALVFGCFLFGGVGVSVVCGGFSGRGDSERAHGLLGRKLELLLGGSCTHEVAARHGFGSAAVGNREHMGIALERRGPIYLHGYFALWGDLVTVGIAEDELHRVDTYDFMGSGGFYGCVYGIVIGIAKLDISALGECALVCTGRDGCTVDILCVEGDCRVCDLFFGVSRFCVVVLLAGLIGVLRGRLCACGLLVIGYDGLGGSRFAGRLGSALGDFGGRGFVACGL